MVRTDGRRKIRDFGLEGNEDTIAIRTTFFARSTVASMLSPPERLCLFFVARRACEIVRAWSLRVRTALPIIGGDLPIIGGDLPIIGGDLPTIGGDLPIIGGDLPIIGGIWTVKAAGEVAAERVWARGFLRFECFVERRFATGENSARNPVSFSEIPMHEESFFTGWTVTL